MINFFEVNETNKMIEQENLDVRTITMGISLMDCIDADLDKLNENIYVVFCQEYTHFCNDPYGIFSYYCNNRFFHNIFSLKYFKTPSFSKQSLFLLLQLKNLPACIFHCPVKFLI